MTQDERTIGESVSDWVASFVGSWAFIVTAFLFSGAWILLNTLAYFDVIAWDKHPYILLNLFLSFVAAFQAPFILMSQRRLESRQDRAYRNYFADIIKRTDRISEEIKELKDH